MLARLKSVWKRLAGRPGGSTDGPPAPATEYNGYRIRPAPYQSEGRYQTAGVIEKIPPKA